MMLLLQQLRLCDVYSVCVGVWVCVCRCVCPWARQVKCERTSISWLTDCGTWRIG